MMRKTHQTGFTLVELVMVIVLVGIVAGILAPMIVQSVSAYRDSQARSELVSRGRLALDRLAREIRQATPNSLQVLNGGLGIEFLSSRTGGRYIDLHDNFGAANYPANSCFRKNANLTSLYVLGTGYALQANDLLVIGNTSPAELIAGTTVTTVNAVGAYDADGNGSNDSQLLSLPVAGHKFPNDSPGMHFEICDTTHEVGQVGTAIRWRTSTGLANYDGAMAAGWGANQPILVDGVDSLTFTYNAGTPQSSGVLRIALVLSDGAETIRLYQEVHVRNTP